MNKASQPDQFLKSIDATSAAWKGDSEYQKKRLAIIVQSIDHFGSLEPHPTPEQIKRLKTIGGGPELYLNLQETALSKGWVRNAADFLALCEPIGASRAAKEIEDTFLIAHESQYLQLPGAIDRFRNFADAAHSTECYQTLLSEGFSQVTTAAEFVKVAARPEKIKDAEREKIAKQLVRESFGSFIEMTPTLEQISEVRGRFSSFERAKRCLVKMFDLAG